MSDDLDSKHGVQSLEIGMGILRAMMDGQRSMMLKDIAAAADMPASKAHRYLVSLIRAGLVEQDPMSSRYDLGPLALNLGLVALDRLDRRGRVSIHAPVKRATDAPGVDARREAVSIHAPVKRATRSATPSPENLEFQSTPP